MGLFKRMELVVKSKTSKLLDRYEDPRETLDYSYQKQLELLQQVKRSTATVITAKKRLELQRVKLQQNIQKLDSQAKDSVNAGRDDLARLVLERKANNVIEIENLTLQIQEQEIEQQKLINTEKKLSAKVNAFRTKKETIKAQYTAAEAQVKVKEAVTGISEEMADVGFAIDRAEEKTETMRAKSAALDEMVELGALDEIGGDDEIERELKKMKTTTGVDDELANGKMIIRVVTEGQYEVSDSLLDELNELDNEIVGLIESGDETRFRDVLRNFISLIRENGKPLDTDVIVESDLIVPPEDLTLSEATKVFNGEGLIPD